MGKRVLVTGAGTGASNNLIRSLRAGDPPLGIVGCHTDRFVLKASTADHNYLIPASDRPGFAAALRRVVATEGIDLLIPNNDPDVRAIAALRGRIGCRLFLPRRAVIEQCRDKYRLATFLRARDIPAPLSYPVRDPDTLAAVFRRFPRGSRLWCRLRTGNGAIGAIPVRSPEQARSWIRCWEEVRAVPARAFAISKYLPGRDFACQGLWKDGRLVLAKTWERLSYFGRGNQPALASSIAALAKTVREPRVVEICAAAIRALDARASGAFTVDLKADAQGTPRITEINAGRLSSGTNLLDLTGKHNMAVTYVRLGLDEPVELREEYDAVEDHYLLRDLDSVPALFHADELFDGIQEA
jgi:biotin carboxylase